MYIQTARLMLKPISDSDQTAMISILTDDIVKKTYLLPDFRTKEQAVMLFSKLREYSRSDMHYVRGIYLNETLIGILNDVEIREGSIELGYVIHPDYHNHGYATEALTAAIRDLFEHGFTTVIAGAFEDNLASIRVMEKAGMSRLNRNEEIEYRGDMHQCVYYSTTRKVIFLDIDGVLNSEFWNNTHEIELCEGTLIDQEKVELLARLVKNTGAEIILHSGWRFWFDDGMNPLTKESRILSDMLHTVGISLAGKTPDHSTEEIRKTKSFSLVKAGEILEWLDEHREVEKWIVLDDLDLHNEVIKKHQIMTDPSIGLTEEDIQKAYCLLRK